MVADMESQNEIEDNGLPDPGAPTPLSALEVRRPTGGRNCNALRKLYCSGSMDILTA